jgi:hypothetical protein
MPPRPRDYRRRVLAFPDFREPFDVAMAEVDRIVGLLADRGLEPGIRYPGTAPGTTCGNHRAHFPRHP